MLSPAETPSAPNVPLGANLSPPVGLLPPGPAIISAPGSGQPGSSSVSMAPGTQTTGTANAGPDVVSTGPLAIGRAKYAGNRTDYWSGAIDEVHAYDHVLTEQEISSLARRGSRS